MPNAVFQQACPFALRAARIRARAAVRAGAVPLADRDDLEQEGLIACWRAARHFDHHRASLKTFVECVIATRLASVIRAARRKPTMQPLDLAAEYGVGPEAVAFHLRSDVARVLSQLNFDDHRVAVALMEFSPAEASRRLRVARSTVYQRIGRLRSIFITAGITSNYFVERSARL